VFHRFLRRQKTSLFLKETANPPRIHAHEFRAPDGNAGQGQNEQMFARESFPPARPLAPHECPSLVGGMAGEGEKICVSIETRLNFF